MKKFYNSNGYLVNTKYVVLSLVMDKDNTGIIVDCHKDEDALALGDKVLYEPDSENFLYEKYGTSLYTVPVKSIIAILPQE